MTFSNPIVNVTGIPSAILTQLEYTNAHVASAYLTSILAFINVLSISKSANQYPANNVSAGNIAQVNAALQSLTHLAKYGVIVTSSGQVIFPSSVVSAGFLAAHNLSSKVPPSAGKSSYSLKLMTMTMAQDYNAILQSLAAVGVNVNAAGNNIPTVNVTQLSQWRDLAVQVSAIARIVQAAELEGVSGASNLQNLIEVDYVQTGNQIITNNLAQLNSALQLTQQALSYLTLLQNLHNNVTTPSSTFSGGNLQNPGGAGTPSAWAPSYLGPASAFFNKPVTPIIISTVAPGGPHYVSSYKQLVSIRMALSAQVKALSATAASTVNNPTSLYGTLKKVLGDINSSFVDASTGLPALSTTTPSNAAAGYTKWMLDNYSAFNSPTANQAGQFQQNITTAITAAENLNDTQKATVRNFMFVFQEYYQSASAALQAITQIIQKMAQNIGR